MIEVVARGTTQFNNSAQVANSFPKRLLKQVYYRFMIQAYKILGRGPDLVLANSTWTKNHLLSLWGANVSTLYPPCDIQEFAVAKQYRGEAFRNAKNVVISFA